MASAVPPSYPLVRFLVSRIVILSEAKDLCTLFAAPILSIIETDLCFVFPGQLTSVPTTNNQGFLFRKPRGAGMKFYEVALKFCRRLL